MIWAGLLPVAPAPAPVPMQGIGPQWQPATSGQAALAQLSGEMYAAGLIAPGSSGWQ